MGLIINIKEKAFNMSTLDLFREDIKDITFLHIFGRLTGRKVADKMSDFINGISKTGRKLVINLENATAIDTMSINVIKRAILSDLNVSIIYNRESIKEFLEATEAITHVPSFRNKYDALSSFGINPTQDRYWKERRSQKRVQSFIPIEIKALTNGNGTLFAQAIITNISAAGLFIENVACSKSEENLLTDSDCEIELNFSLPVNGKKPKIIGKGKVAWIYQDVNSHSIGIRFLELSEDKKEKISQYVNLELAA